MASIESLKEKARRHEQKEEWQKALDQYRQAIDKLAEDDEPDIGLYNRVGDLQTRLGNVDAAVEAYEEAVDLYVDADLENNAIAVCKKIIRNLPQKHSVYLKMGQIRAQQGFLVDARQNFLAYAERMQGEGDIDEALRALVEFADLAPDDVEIRMAVASQLEQHDREDEAVEQLVAGYRTLMSQGQEDEAAAFEEKIRELDPSADVGELVAAGAETGFDVGEEREEEEEGEGEIEGDFGEISFDEEDEEEEEEEEMPAEVEVGGFDIAAEDEEEAEDEWEAVEEEAEPLPTMDFGDEEEEEEEAEPLPTMDFGDEEEEEEEAEPLPTMDFGDEEEEEEEEEEEPVLDAAAFGESDRGEKETQEYVESGEEMEEVDYGLDEAAFETAEEDEEEAVVEAGEPAEAVEEAAEEAVAEARVEEAEAPEPAAEEVVEGDPGALLEEGRRLLSEGEREEGLERLRTAQEGFESAGDMEGVEDATALLVEEEPDEVAHRQRLVELSFRKNDPEVLASAYMELARCLERNDEPQRAQAVYQQVLSVDPDHAEAKEAAGQAEAPSAPVREVASSEDYVDLGSMILEEEEEEKSTRFVVAYEEPTGDEQADFANMLTQFKQKVTENVSADDVMAHHDLGTAYKEMGLLDEAIEEFQQALRASSDHLPTYELLGQCFIEQGELEAAVRSLKRALEMPYEIEDELLGIYYYLGRAHEELGNDEEAVELYDRVFALDINFADVTERLRDLR